MLDISVTLEGDKVIIEGLAQFAQELPGAITKGLTRTAVGVYNLAYRFLSGAGAKGISKQVTSKKTGKKYLKWQKQSIPAGGYPVPVRSGWLRQMLDWLKPGESKTVASFSEMGSRTTHSGGTFTAGENEVIIYDAAEYAHSIHEATGSSAKYGRRPFIVGAFEMFNQGGHIKEVLMEEINKVKRK
jgi:hypothetical protein